MGNYADCPACHTPVHITGYSGSQCPECRQRVSVRRDTDRTLLDAVDAGEVYIDPNPHKQKCDIPWGLRDSYPDEWTEGLKESIRERDGRRCSFCGLADAAHRLLRGTKLHVHHTDGDKYNCRKNNLLSLCSTCHLRLEHSLHR